MQGMSEKRTLQNFVDGQYVAPATAEYADLVDPATGDVFAAAPVSGKADVDRAVTAAGNAFEKWRDTTPAERQLALLRIADSLERRAEEVIAAECQNTGKPLGLTASEELPPCVDQIRFFAGAARLLEGRSAGEYMAGHTSFVRREPIGVCAQVSPWNYPLMMAIWKIAPALAAGNTVVLKPAETTPITTIKLAELAAEIFPAGVLNVLGGHGQPAGASLVTHPDVDMVSLTGSPETGKWIAKAASETLKRVHLELGGKAPVIVFDDVDMSTALETIAGTALYNAGQDCTAATRVLASSKVYDDIVNGLAKEAQGYKVGDTFDPETTLGPLNSMRQRERVERFLGGKPDHAEVVIGGKEPDLPGTVVEPTV